MYPPSASRSSIRRSRPISIVDLAIFVVGLIAAATSGVVAYRIVGPYGDGFLNVGLYRTRDPETGKDVIYREVRQADGSVTRYMASSTGVPFHTIRATGTLGGRQQTLDVYAEQGKLSGFGLDSDGDGQIDVRDYFDEKMALVKQGFSVSGTGGVIDAWQYRDPSGAVVRIETSRSQDGVVDRWEHYEAGQLVRAEEDDDHDGKPDHWLTYEEGILIHEARDRNRDGQPDSRP
ncbi:MAG: hypothetical protein ABL986_22710 [Vicinamibacterales bacterium]